MDESQYDPFIVVMILMFIKEVLHSEFFHVDEKTLSKLQAQHTFLMAFCYVCSWGLNFWFAWINIWATIGGFGAALAWYILMPSIFGYRKEGP